MNASPTGQELLGPGMAVAMYPQAKEYLRARGYSAEAVEKMAVVEAVGRYFVQTFDEEEDDLFKWMGLPPAQRAAGLAWEKERVRDRSTKGMPKEGNMLVAALLPW